MVPSWGSSLGYEYTMTQYVEYLERLQTRCNPGLIKIIARLSHSLDLEL